MRLNPELFRSLCDLGYGEGAVQEADQNKEKRASGNQKGRSDEELLAILADSERLPRAAHAKKLDCSVRWLRKLLEKAEKVAAAATAAQKWTVVPESKNTRSA